MPVIVNTRVGTVREVFGHAILQAADGSERPLQRGDKIRQGDKILTEQDSIVEIIEDVAPRLAPPPEIDPVVDDPQGEIVLPPPELGPGDGGSGSLQPGLRVGRIDESLAALLNPTTGIEGSSTELFANARGVAPETQLPPTPPDDEPGASLSVQAPALGRDNTPALSGRSDAPAGTVVTLLVTDASGAQQTLTAIVQPDGSFAVDVATPLPDGPYTVAASLTAPNGDLVSADTEGVIDTTAPAPTLTLDPIAGNDVLDDAEAASAFVTVSGRAGGDARPGDTVIVTVGGQAFEATVQADGSFAVQVSGALLAASAAGGVSASLTRSDDAGNVATVTADRDYSVNTAPVAVDDVASQAEDGPAASGDLTPPTVGQDSDPEGDALTVVAITAGGSVGASGGVGSAVAGAWGSLVVQADGSYAYTPGAAAQSLRDGQTVTDTFAYRVSDAEGNSDTAVLTVTLTGADDAPVFSGDGTGAVVEDGVLTAVGVLGVVDADADESALQALSDVAGAYGRFSIDSAGRWVYTLDNAGPGVQALAAGQQVSDVFTVTSVDGSTATVTVTVTGTDDAPVIGVGSGSVVEDTAPTASGTLTAVDVDNPELAFVPATVAGSVGVLTVNALGEWTYALGDAAQALRGGQIVTETFTVTLNDGSTTTVTVTVTGTDDLPVISAGTGSVTEDTAPTAGGTLTATDADNTALAFVPATLAGSVGALTLNALGEWTYSLGDAAQALAADQVVAETFTVALNDGSTTTVTVTVTGTDDLPVISAGTGSVTEDTAPTATGTLTATDADNPALAFVPATLAGNVGGLTLNALGEWTYALGDAAQALAADQVVTETFTVMLNDGSTTTVTITVTGTDDGAVISTGTGSVTEDTSPIATGTLTATDADNPALAFVPATLAGSVGALTLNALGEWTYALGDAAQALAADQVVTESFTVTLNDGSTTTVTITVTATDDGAVISTGTGSVTEDTSPIATGTLTATDADNPALAFVPATLAGSVGALTLNALGEWTYALGDAAQALAADQVITEAFTVTLNDGSTTTVTITVTGTDDAPVVSAGTGSVTEDTSPTATGTLTATDADNPALAFVPATLAGSVGALTLNALGEWTYALGDAAQALAADQVVTESFTVTLNDGSTTTVTITVTGTDDAPVISAGTGSVTEDTSPIATGTLTATDADNPALAFVPATLAGSVGALTLNALGEWTYALGDAAQALAADQVITEAFTVTLNDGSTTTVTITVTGTDDAPVVSAGTGSVTEDTSPTATGTLTATDADNPALAFVPATLAGSVGALTLNALGEWTYSLGDAAQALAADQIVTESFTVTLNDGSTTTVTITVTGTDDAPVISAGTGSVTEDTSPTATGTLTATDADNPALAFVGTTQVGSYGTLTVTADGVWSYALDPAAQTLAEGQQVGEVFNVALNDGSVTSVGVTITGRNDDPLAQADAYTVAEGETVSLPVLVNDSDIDALDVLTVQSYTQPRYGSLSLNPDGSFSYTADPDRTTSTAGFEVGVAAALGLPGNSVLVHPEQIPLAGDYLVVPPRSLTANSLTSLGRLPGGDFVLRVSNGSDVEQVVAVTGSGAAPDFVVTIPANSAAVLNIGPVAAGVIYSAIDFGNAATNDTPLPLSLPEPETFSYTISDGQGGTSTTTVSITLTPGNDDPLARADARSVDEDSAGIAGNVIRPLDATSGDRNDTDDDGNALRVTGVAAGALGSAAGNVGTALAGALGTLVLQEDGSYVYTPGAGSQALAEGESAVDVFTYTVSDGQGGSASTTLGITVLGRNDAPLASDDSDTVAEGGTLVLPVLVNDSDPDTSDVLTVQAYTQPRMGSVALNADGSFTYTANADYYTTSTAFGVVVDASLGLPDNVIRVHPEQLDSAGDYLVIPPRSLTANSLTTLGRLPDGDYIVRVSNGGETERVVSVTGAGAAPDYVVTIPANSAIVLNIGPVPAGVLYSAIGFGNATTNNTLLSLSEPVAETFSYTITDGNGGTSTATVTLEVTPSNDKPVALADLRRLGEATTSIDGNVIRPLVATSGDRNDTDVDGDRLSVAGVAAGTVANAEGGVGSALAGDFGSLVLGAGGGYTYTPGAAAQALNSGQTGVDVFSYTVSDARGGSATTTLRFEIAGSDDAPPLPGPAPAAQAAALDWRDLLGGDDIGALDLSTLGAPPAVTAAATAPRLDAIELHALPPPTLFDLPVPGMPHFDKLPVDA